ncbi:hypothetical protein GCM10009605_18450 [Nocardiopsis composta]
MVVAEPHREVAGLRGVDPPGTQGAGQPPVVEVVGPLLHAAHASNGSPGPAPGFPAGAPVGPAPPAGPFRGGARAAEPAGSRPEGPGRDPTDTGHPGPDRLIRFHTEPPGAADGAREPAEGPLSSVLLGTSAANRSGVRRGLGTAGTPLVLAGAVGPLPRAVSGEPSGRAGAPLPPGGAAVNRFARGRGRGPSRRAADPGRARVSRRPVPGRPFRWGSVLASAEPTDSDADPEKTDGCGECGNSRGAAVDGSR